MPIKNKLKIELAGFWPKIEIKDKRLRKKIGKDFLGPDYIVSFLQKAVYKSVPLIKGLEEEILKEENIRETAFNKFSSSMLRGHSLDGTAGIALKLHGSKLLDSALTGIPFSRSFVTSGRRAKIHKENIIIPDSIDKKYDLRKEYVETSETAIEIYDKIIDKIGSKQLASKVVPYNNPCDLYIRLPLSSIMTLALELEQQKQTNQIWMPREVEELISRLENDILPDIDMKIMYDTRKAALRDTYLHWYVFKGKDDNFATEMAKLLGNPLEPTIIPTSINIQPTKGLRKKLKYLEEKISFTHTILNPKELSKASRENLLLLRDIVDSYNDSISLKTVSSLSWRVWSEQKRHSTLRQCVESIYRASDRAYEIIESSRNKKDLFKRSEKAFVIPPEIKKDKELLRDYVWISSKQHLLRKELLDASIEERDAIYIVPRNTRLRTVETYDLINLIDLELPLRTCTTCEPERRATAEKKAEIIKDTLSGIIPELNYLIGPKCILGYCTEPKFCGKILEYNPDYSVSLHNHIRENLIKKASEKIS